MLRPSGFFTCPKGCGRVYRHKGNMNRHVTVECGIERKYKCHLCPTTCHYSYDLRRHFETVHRLTQKEIEDNIEAQD